MAGAEANPRARAGGGGRGCDLHDREQGGGEAGASDSGQAQRANTTPRDHVQCTCIREHTQWLGLTSAPLSTTRLLLPALEVTDNSANYFHQFFLFSVQLFNCFCECYAPLVVA